MNDLEAEKAIIEQFSLFVRLVLDGGVVVGIAIVALGIFGFYKQTEFPQNYPFARNVFYIFTGTMLISSSYIFQAFDQTMLPSPDGVDVVKSFSESGWNERALYMDEQAVLDVVKNGIEAATVNSGGSIGTQLIPPRTAALIVGFMYLIGVISFVRGIYMLKDAGDMTSQQQGQSPIGKAIVHMVSGVIAVNINQFGCIVGATFGTTLFCAA